MTTKKNLSGVLREGMQSGPLVNQTTNKPDQPKQLQSDTQEQQELIKLKAQLEQERERVLCLQQELHEQKKQIEELSQSLQKEESNNNKEKMKFIVPVGSYPYHNHLVIMPATSSELTDEQIGWFD
jgi:hypothetical protein